MPEESRPPLFTALYLPSIQDEESDPSRAEFPSEEAAWEYVFSTMCLMCQDEHRVALLGDGHPEYANYTTPEGISPQEYPPCSCEWMVVSSDKAEASHEERMEDAGYEPMDFIDILKGIGA